MNNQYQYDVLIIGSGASGLSLALKLADHARVAIFSKDQLRETATFYAQGGISAVLDQHDSIESHIEDTLNVGAGLCDHDIVKMVVGMGAESIDWLTKIGVHFTKNENYGYHLNQESGHSHRRILHVTDATGKVVETTLEVAAQSHPNIDIYEYHIAIDLITQDNCCLGAYIYDESQQKIKTFAAKFVVLATGGAGKTYLYTSNPDSATGDGIAMAWRANCRIANMEFIQFHPTCLFHPDAKSFLISESLRGEGAKLLLPNGSEFMHEFDPRKELAPRDIVSRAVDHKMKTLGLDYVCLDISHQDKNFILNHFPTIESHCRSFGIDITRSPIPVVPAAHYTIGGVMVDQYGHTDLANLYAIGEVSCSGLHGANRMASNSLLECIVFAHIAYMDIKKRLPQYDIPTNLPLWDESQVTHSPEEIVVSHNWDELRRFMWNYVGIVRSSKRLQYAKNRINLLQSEINEYYHHFKISKDLLELRNLAIISDLIIRSAMSRHESRGVHYVMDYPEQNEQLANKNTILRKD